MRWPPAWTSFGKIKTGREPGAKRGGHATRISILAGTRLFSVWLLDTRGVWEVYAMKLNWFCPVPPSQTEIANYSVRLLPVLRRHADITLWTDQPEWDSTLEHQAEVRRYDPQSPPWTEMNRADLNIYHIGNNHPFHGAIWKVSCCCPGLVILHDFRLQHLFAGLYLDAGERDKYLSQLVRYYGSNARPIG